MLKAWQQFTQFMRRMQHSAKWLPTFGPSRSAWAISPPVGCQLTILTIAILLLLSPKADTHFTIPRKVEGWVRLYLGKWKAEGRDGIKGFLRLKEGEGRESIGERGGKKIGDRTVQRQGECCSKVLGGIDAPSKMNDLDLCFFYFWGRLRSRQPLRHIHISHSLRNCSKYRFIGSKVPPRLCYRASVISF